MSLRAELRGLLAAVAFLTRLPVGRLAALDGGDVARASLVFPLVGAGLGGLVGVVAQGLSHRLSPLLAAALAVGVVAVATGALHLDAAADTADALGGGTRERRLEIMRDHAIGAYGAVALVLDVGIRIAALAALAGRHQAVLAGVAAGALSRATAPLVGSVLPYARASGGSGQSIARSSRLRAVGAGCIATGIAVAALGSSGAVLAGCAAALAGALALTWRRWLGGVTGDTLGAGIEATELLCLVVAVALVGAGAGAGT